MMSKHLSYLGLEIRPMRAFLAKLKHYAVRISMSLVARFNLLCKILLPFLELCRV
jgi:hypothetical protein